MGGLVSVIIFQGFSLVETPVSGIGSGAPNQRLRVFVLFQLSTTWLNSAVKGSAPRLLTSKNRIEKKFWHERQHCSSGNDVFKHNETSTVGQL